MSNVPDRFWMVLRLSKSSNDVQQVDSLPHKKHTTFDLAHAEARRLAEQYPNARGFVVLEAIRLVEKAPATISQSLANRTF